MTGIPCHWIPLHEASEPFILYETPHYRKTEYDCIRLKGDPDLDRLMLAVSRAIAGFPVFRSLLRERKMDGRYLLFWEQVRHRETEIRLADLRSSVEEGLPAREAISGHLRQRLLRGTDLERERPIEIYLFRTAANEYYLTSVWHHAATDGVTMFEFYKRVLAHYDRLFTASQPDWVKATFAPSSVVEKQAGKLHGYTKARFLRESLGSAVKEARRPPARLAQKEKRIHPNRINLIRRIDPEEMKRLRKTSKRLGCSVGDLLLAVSAVAVERWVEKEGASADLVSVWTVTNLRDRLGVGPLAANQSSAVMIYTDPEDRRDLARLVSMVTAERKRQLAEGCDIANFLALIHLIRFWRRFPLRMRRGPVRRILERPCSFVVSNLGLLWPEMKDGRPTGRSFLERAGNLEVMGVDYDFSILRHIGCGFVVHTFRGWLQFNFGILTDLMDRGEAESFLDSYVELLRGIYD